ncbi:DMT family transporter [Leptodesmis sichuanensis]|uniref:DMT family transporter n=1 Tax=Leptodesmis sichuanensis TaxID=2906798 RepID=UPI001F4590DA|nr:DMT family transporter [Leptodesmis sichuanensis]UIE37809.1 EamA family transporter [Leptodesmis sichuanensis A121]
MGQMENRPVSNTSENGRTVESLLQIVTQDLRRLHEGLVTQLSEEVNQLQAEKAYLTEEVKQLKAQHQTLQTQRTAALSQQQIAQQQLWAKQLAMALANHLQSLMVQQMNQMAKANSIAGMGSGLPGSSQLQSDNAQRMLASLDATFSATFRSLQQELNSYHSALSQQLGRMHNLEQQGEAVLQALVSKLQEQLQAESFGSTTALQSPVSGSAYSYSTGEDEASLSETVLQPHARPGVSPPDLSSSPSLSAQAGQTHPVYSPQAPHSHPPQSASSPVISTPIPAPGVPQPLTRLFPKKETNFWAGFILVLFSTVALSIHNVVVRVIGKPSSILGLPEIGGFINITVLGNSLLILWLRMLVVLPLMVAVSMVLYPPVWRDLSQFLAARDRRPLLNVVGSGFFLFLSQVLIYIAIGQIGAGPAVTILFMYPLVTVPLAWILFGDRPTPLRWAVMAIISLGVVFTALPSIDVNKVTSGGEMGVTAAIAAGIAFALYLIFMQLGFKKLHPVPVSLIQFFTIFVLSSIILIFLGPNLGVLVQPEKRVGFIVSGIILGALTLIGYLANNFGVRFMGAALASIIASIGPVVTALLAWILINNPLQGVQILGIVMVTLGVGLLSVERMKLQMQAAKT